MKIPKYLSPTSISKFYANREEFYLSYLAEQRPPRMAQTQPMSIGSAFDAYVKNYLVEKLTGSATGEFDLENILTSQVEEHNREWAREEGKYVFDCYRDSGALADLMIELDLASDGVRFEFTVQGGVFSETLGEIPLLGKPDICFKTAEGYHIILDWKVNGYCGRGSVSPKAGFAMVRDGCGQGSRGNGQPHKDYHGMVKGGIHINIGKSFDQVDSTWADQLCIYSWLLGVPVGETVIIGIEQIVCKGVAGERPLLRCASHRGAVYNDYQRQLFAKIEHVWKTIQDGAEAIFSDEGLNPAESVAKCAELDNYHKAFGDQALPEEAWFTSITRA